ncbi:hypothetical protein ACIBG8_35405 [Nonomuraea sp. NPDC050556]|uniref:hypothetical protein n=1 Tax=Nonomuraea sp. NPDC050556 TaxID=3364369 RepID=UPI00378CF5C4
MHPLPTTGVARFPGGRQLKVTTADTHRVIDEAVTEMSINHDVDANTIEVRVVPANGAGPKIYVLSRYDVYGFMQHGIAEPAYDPASNSPKHYKTWPIPGPYSTGDKPHPWDVVQGEKQDCRILSALQVLALCQPKILMQALTCDVGAGTCTVMLRRTPGPKGVAATTAPLEAFTFTTALPCKWTGPNTATQLLYAGADSVIDYLPLWPSFFEKALAVMWGGYGALAGAEERSLMSALGITTMQAIQFTKAARTGEQNVRGWITTLCDAFAAGCPTTAFIIGKQHNYGIVGVSPTHVVVCDPNSRQTGDYYARWNDSPRIFDGTPAMLQSSVNFPMKLTWAQFFENFMWAYIFRPSA